MGCSGSDSATPTEQATMSVQQQRQQFHQQREGFLWKVFVQEPSLASAKRSTLLDFGQSVCDSINGGVSRKAAIAFGQTHGLSLRQMSAVADGATSFLCPELVHLSETEPSS
jgi:hypothetical protein